jgi:hypothetical protein
MKKLLGKLLTLLTLLGLIILAACSSQVPSGRSNSVEETMDWLNQHREQVGEFAAGWGHDGVSVTLDMIRYSEEEIARFREEVLDSRFITFHDPRAYGMGRITPLHINPELMDYVAMTIIELSSNSVTITIQNYSEIEPMTGHGYSLEVYENDEWRLIPGVRPFTDEGLIIFPQDSLEMNKCLLEYMHLIEPGLYRIRKDVMIDTWQSDRPPIATRHDVVAEFYWGI